MLGPHVAPAAPAMRRAAADTSVSSCHRGMAQSRMPNQALCKASLPGARIIF